MDDKGLGIFMVFGMIIMLVLGVIAGGAIMMDSHRKEAIKAGVARYTVNATTGETRFEFIKPGVQR